MYVCMYIYVCLYIPIINKIYYYIYDYTIILLYCLYDLLNECYNKLLIKNKT